MRHFLELLVFGHLNAHHMRIFMLVENFYEVNIFFFSRKDSFFSKGNNQTIMRKNKIPIFKADISNQRDLLSLLG